MVSLGETMDPRALVPGDPGSVEDKAAALRKEAERYATAKDDLRRVDIGDWWGQASEGFRNVLSSEPPKWSSICDSVETTSGALTGYAGVLHWAQGQAAEAVALWEKGEDSTRAARLQYESTTSAPQVPFSDPGEQYRQQARALLIHAREKLHTAGTRAAAAIRGEGEKPGALDHFVNEITGGWTTRGRAEASGPNAGVSAKWPNGYKVGELKAFAELAKASAQGSVGNEYVQLSGKAEATVAAEASVSGQVTRDAIIGKAEAMAGAKASAQGKVEFGPYAGALGKAEAFAGAKAGAEAEISKTGVSVNADAFAGAKVTGKVGADVAGIGINTTAEGWAGAGAGAGFGVEYENGTFTVDANAGLAWGLGGKLGFELSVDTNDVAATATDAAQFVGNAAASTGEAIGDATSSAYDTVTFWN